MRFLKRAWPVMVLLCAALSLGFESKDATIVGMPAWEQSYGGTQFQNYSLESGVYDLNAAWGLSFSDYDHDGYVDLFVNNHMHIPSRLYRNCGDGTFVDVSENAGIHEWLDDHDSAWGDFDNDGDEDLTITNGYYRADGLFRNEGDGTFVRIDKESNINMGAKGRGRNVAFMDFDRNGHLDVFVANLHGPNFVYWNLGEGKFLADTKSVRMDTSYSHDSAGVGDLNGDGLMDVVIASVGRNEPPQVFYNLGARHFEDRSASVGLLTRGPTGAVILGDYDNDGDLDVFLASHSPSASGRLFENSGGGIFRDATEKGGLLGSTGKGCAGSFFDYDNDGDLDLYIVNSGTAFGKNERNLLYENLGNGRFREIAEELGLALVTPGNGAGFAVADVNRDGCLDFAITNGKCAISSMGPTMLFLNRNGGNHYLRLDLEGTVSNRNGYGALVYLYAGGKLQSRQVGLRNAHSQNEATVHFGLGSQERASRIIIRWPSGIIQVLNDLPVDRTLKIREPAEDRWFGDTPEILALRERASTAARDAAGTIKKVDDELMARAEQIKEAWVRDVLRESEIRRRITANPITEENIEEYHRQHLDRYTVPEVVWIEHVAIGHFAKDGALRNEPKEKREAELDRQRTLAEKVRKELEQGKTAFEIGSQDHIQAWTPPFFSDPRKIFRGYVSSGYYTKAMLTQHFFADTAEIIWSAEQGTVIGPVLLREGMDVQDPDSVDSMFRVFRVGDKQPSYQVPLSEVSGTIRQFLEHERDRKISGEIQKTELFDRELSPSMLEALSQEALAQATAEREMAKRDIGEDAIRTYYAEHVSQYTSEPAVLARHLSIRNPGEAKKVALRLREGQAFPDILEAMQIPDITVRPARGGALYQEMLTLTRSRALTLTGEDVFDDLLLFGPGKLAGPYTHLGLTHYLYVIEAVDAHSIPFEEVKKDIRSTLRFRNYVEILDGLSPTAHSPDSKPNDPILENAQ